MCALGAGRAPRRPPGHPLEGEPRSIGASPHALLTSGWMLSYSALCAEACVGRAETHGRSRGISPKDVTLPWTPLGIPWLVAASLQSLPLWLLSLSCQNCLCPKEA